MNKNIAVFALVMFVLGSIAMYSAPQVFADWLIDRSGTLVKLDQAVLGDDDVADQKRELAKQQEETKREAVKTQREQVRETAKQALERKIELNKVNNKNVKNEFEISASGGELKVKQKTKLINGQEKEMELELKENETLHVDQEDGESVDINVTNPGELEIKKDKFKGRTRLPISINSENELMVTRPDGTTKVVSVLPDQAITKMMEKGVLVSSDNVELTTGEEGEPVYEVNQEVSKKVLGFINMNFGTRTTVSATDENDVTIESTETSPWRRFLERLAR